VYRIPRKLKKRIKNYVFRPKPKLSPKAKKALKQICVIALKKIKNQSGT